MKRIGFCCKWIDTPDQMDGIKPKDDAKKYNTNTTTISWLNRQSVSVAEQKLWDIMNHNINALAALVDRVGNLEHSLRMVRLSSDVLPGYTEAKWKKFWKSSDVQSYAEKNFLKIGNIAREKNVRLSFHPGQFCVLASNNDQIVESSIEEFEYHTDMARWMGYGKSFQDFKINVHISGKRGPDGLRNVYNRLSTEARNCITIENEEISHGIDDCLLISDIVPIVLDIHHHWVREGNYIQTSDDRVKRVVDSWRGIRPVIHYSVSREEYFDGHSRDDLPSRDSLISKGFNKQQLRAHSQFYWNNAVNQWALSFHEYFDIQCESKAKNLASFKLHEFAKTIT